MTTSDKRSVGVEPTPQRSIFLSHAVADRKLAAALQTAVAEGYSNLVDMYASSDSSAGGGLMPGDEWFETIHSELDRAETVWVLATPTSIKHPWLYWEAGIGRALCRDGIAVLRVGLTAAQLPSPLSAYQSYDGLRTGDATSIDTMFNKVAEQIGMKLSPVLVDDVIGRWLAYATNHEPESAETSSPVEREQVSAFEGLLSRLDAAVQRLESRTPLAPRAATQRARRESAWPPRSVRRAAAYEAEARGSATTTLDTPLDDVDFIRSRAELIAFLKTNPTARPTRVDEDGDVFIDIPGKGVFLRGEWFETLQPEQERGPLRTFLLLLRSWTTTMPGRDSGYLPQSPLRATIPP